MIVQGAVSPDEYIVFKPLKDGFNAIIEKKLGQDKMMFMEKEVMRVKIISTEQKFRTRFCLSETIF
jgi:pyruvate,water dikinase